MSLPAPYPPVARSPWPAVLAVLTGVWSVAVVAATQTYAWQQEQFAIIEGNPEAVWRWPLAAVGGAVLVAVPSLLLAWKAQPATVRAAGRAWSWAALSLGVLGSLRAVPVLAHELYLALLALGAVVLALVVSRRRPRFARSPGVGLGVAAGLACLLPWLWLGALGGVLETVLAVLAALAVAWLACVILGSGFWEPFAGRRRVLLIVVGGLVAGVALAALAGGVGASGLQLAEFVGLPAVSFAAAALYRSWRGAAIWPQFALVALAVLGPLAFIDPEETSLVLLGASLDMFVWATVAACAAAALALLVGVAFLIMDGRAGRWVALGSACVVGLVSVGVYAGPGHPGLYGDRLLVVLKSQANLSGLDRIPDRTRRVTETYQRLVAHADETQAPLRRELRRLHLTYTPYYLVNAIEVHGGSVVREWLSTRGEVDRVLLSPRLRPLPARGPLLLPSEAAPTGPLWNIEDVHADAVWRTGVTGRGIVVGTSDSGVDATHPTLAGGYRGGDDSWFDPWNHTRTPTDHGGHGTHTIGTAVGRAPDGRVPSVSQPDGVRPPGVNAIGVAPGAQWIGCVNLDRNLGSPALYLDCLQFMLAPFPYGGDPFRDGRPTRAPHVLTNSWGCPELEGCDATALRPATAAFAAAGIFFVAAAGNTGPSCESIDDPPAPYADVLTVGAVDRTDNVPAFSSRGPDADGTPKPDVAAPGVGVVSALPGNTYGALDGTSMAAPHVAGVVALMWSANPALVGDIARTRDILRETAVPPLPQFGEGGDDACGSAENVRGTGVVNASAAVTQARNYKGTS